MFKSDKETVIKITVKQNEQKKLFVYENFFIKMLGSFSTNNYWSSSEYDTNNAWYQDMNNGNQNNNDKDNTNYVRCARDFKQKQKKRA